MQNDSIKNHRLLSISFCFTPAYALTIYSKIMKDCSFRNQFVNPLYSLCFSQNMIFR
jgi:hypothetical protein